MIRLGFRPARRGTLIEGTTLQVPARAEAGHRLDVDGGIAKVD